MFLLALRKEPSCIYTACICWRFKIFKAFLVPLDLARNFINLYPSYPYQMHHTFFIFYLALAARYFIPFNFYFFLPQFFSYLDTGTILILKYSSCMKFPSTSWTDVTDGNWRVGAGRGRTEIQNSTYKCSCPLYLRSDRSKKTEAYEPRQGLTPHFRIHKSSGVRAPRQSGHVCKAMPHTNPAAMNSYKLCKGGRIHSTPFFWVEYESILQHIGVHTT